jgi:hypothetical protein
MPAGNPLWQKGQSGNPGGRPKSKHMRDPLIMFGNMSPEEFAKFKCKTMWEKAAYEQFQAICEGDGKYKEKARIYAAVSAVVDGKPRSAEEDNLAVAGQIHVHVDMAPRKPSPALEAETIEDAEVVEGYTEHGE